MSIYDISGLPEITDEEQKFLCDNPNTADIVDWVREYAAKATHALRQQLEEAQRKLKAVTPQVQAASPERTAECLANERRAILSNPVEQRLADATEGGAVIQKLLQLVCRRTFAQSHPPPMSV